MSARKSVSSGIVLAALCGLIVLGLVAVIMGQQDRELCIKRGGVWVRAQYQGPVCIRKDALLIGE